MGNLATPDALIARWHEVLMDPALQDLPYKIEINARGKVEMSPASNRHGRLQAFISGEFARQLPPGIIITECSILTRIGIRVPDVVWAEINEKTAAYLAAGAREAWIVSEQGSIRVMGPDGEKAASEFPVRMTLPAPSPNP